MFGDLIVPMGYMNRSGCASSTRGIFAGGFNLLLLPTQSNTLRYIRR